MTRDRRDGWGRFDQPWGGGRRRGRRRRQDRWPESGLPPEVAAERFAEAVEQVATKVGTALERAFEGAGEKVDRAAVEDVGSRVATAIEQAIDKVGEAIPKTDPDAKLAKADRKLLQRRDRANSQLVLFACLWAGISAVILVSEGMGALAPVIVLAAVFGGLIARNLVWKHSNRDAIVRAAERMTVREGGEVPQVESEEPPSAEDTAGPEPPAEPDLALDKLHFSEPTQTGPIGAVEQEGLQVMELLREMGEERPDIRASVEATVAKTRELSNRRHKLEAILGDPDLAQLDERIVDLEVRIDETPDEPTRDLYQRTLEQLRSQAESLADVRVMVERLDAYVNASLQSLRTIHIDLLRLQTGDLEDPDQTLRDVTSRAGQLGMEIKSVREVVAEVEQSRRARARAATRQI